MAGARLEVREYMPPYENVVPNLALARAFRRNLEALGLDVLDGRPEAGLGSTDFGNVTRRVPAIEAGIAVAEPGCRTTRRRSRKLRSRRRRTGRSWPPPRGWR